MAWQDKGIFKYVNLKHLRREDWFQKSKVQAKSVFTQISHEINTEITYSSGDEDELLEDETQKDKNPMDKYAHFEHFFCDVTVMPIFHLWLSCL